MKNSIYKNMIDATERLPFAITQKHIDEGVADDCQRCTNAQAIKSLRTVADVRVCRTVSYVLFAWVLETGGLVVNLWGAKRNYYELEAADFTTDPAAYWWCGHIGDEEETKEVKNGLRKVSPVGA